MNLYSIFIILFISLGGLIGFKRGVIKQLVITFGIIFVLILSFSLKNSISLVMYKTLPFIATGLLKDYSALNIIVYELSSFLLLFSLLSTLLIILIKLSGVVEKIIKATFILALPSKILGFILGVLENYIIAFVLIFFLINPAFNINELNKSTTANFILNNTLFISKYTKPTVDGFNEVSTLLKNKNDYSSRSFNCKLIHILKKDNIIKDESVDYLYSSGKIDSSCKGD